MHLMANKCFRSEERIESVTILHIEASEWHTIIYAYSALCILLLAVYCVVYKEYWIILFYKIYEIEHMHFKH